MLGIGLVCFSILEHESDSFCDMLPDHRRSERGGCTIIDLLIQYRAWYVLHCLFDSNQLIGTLHNSNSWYQSREGDIKFQISSLFIRFKSLTALKECI